MVGDGVEMVDETAFDQADRGDAPWHDEIRVADDADSWFNSHSVRLLYRGRAGATRN